jgi:hypothetical protein
MLSDIFDCDDFDTVTSSSGIKIFKHLEILVFHRHLCNKH